MITAGATFRIVTSAESDSVSELLSLSLATTVAVSW